MKKFVLIPLLILFTGCSYSISLVHTEGHATDVVDTIQKENAELKPTLQIPAMAF